MAELVDRLQRMKAQIHRDVLSAKIGEQDRSGLESLSRVGASTPLS